MANVYNMPKNTLKINVLWFYDFKGKLSGEVVYCFPLSLLNFWFSREFRRGKTIKEKKIFKIWLSWFKKYMNFDN